MEKRRGILLDIDYVTGEGDTLIRLFFKGKESFIAYDRFEPYFYVVPSGDPKKVMERLKDLAKGLKIVKRGGREVIQFFADSPRAVPELREIVKKIDGVEETREHAIQFSRRYCIDKSIIPMMNYEVSLKDCFVQEMKVIDDDLSMLNSLAFDLEVYNPAGNVRFEKDPIIMISTAGEGTGNVYTWKEIKRKFVVTLPDETAMLDAFCKDLDKQDVDIIMGYNSDRFDFPYLKNRATILKRKIPVGRDGSGPLLRKTGIVERADVRGRVHFDVYVGVRFLSTIGAIGLFRYTLEDAYRELFGEEKLDIEAENIYKIWDGGDIGKLADYALSDAVATFKIGKEILPMYVSLSRLIALPLYDVSRMATSQMVEWLLMRETFQEKILAPRKPKEDEVKRRIANQIKGGFVREPKPGLHENLIVFDFRSLYPSIIISHNIGPSTLNCDCCKEPHVSPVGHKFCKQRQGFIPKVLDRVLALRFETKRQLKSKKPDTLEFKLLNAKQQSLKILANSFYGYLNFARARWFSRECAEATTSWGRYYIKDAMDKAEAQGFEVVYGDTDSLFVKLPAGMDVEAGKAKAMVFMEGINAELPGKMELEYEGFYTRGIFVTKKSEAKAAKKKYALMGEDGRMKIKGFEYVRRDWALIARKTQKQVLEAVLKDGKPDKAVRIVEQAILALRSGAIPIEELVIYTQLKKSLSSYTAMGPHVMAAKRAKEKGIEIEEGGIVGYVVVSGGGKISDRSYVLEMMGKRKPDVDYYIDHQLLPAVMRILEELGHRAEDLKSKGKQSSLGKWT